MDEASGGSWISDMEAQPTLEVEGVPVGGVLTEALPCPWLVLGPASGTLGHEARLCRCGFPLRGPSVLHEAL